jgi:hypothetical protein
MSRESASPSRRWAGHMKAFSESDPVALKGGEMILSYPEEDHHTH